MTRLLLSILLILFSVSAYGQNNFQASFELGMKSMQEGKYASAITNFQNSLKVLKDKKSSQAGLVHLSLSKAYLANHSLIDAKTHFDQARQLQNEENIENQLNDYSLRLEYEMEKEQDMANTALSSNDLIPYKEYLETYKTAPNREKVQSALDDLWFKKAKVERDRVLMEEYLANFPYGAHRKEANEEIYIMKNRPILIEQYNQKALEVQRRGMPLVLTFSAGAASAIVLPLVSLGEPAGSQARKTYLTAGAIGAGVALLTLYPVLKTNQKYLRYKRKAKELASYISPVVDPFNGQYALSFNISF